MNAVVFDLSDFVTDVFYPCVALGCVLPAGAALFTGFLRLVTVALGIVSDD